MDILWSILAGILLIIILVVTTYFEDFWFNVIGDTLIFGTDFFISWRKYGFRKAVRKTIADWHPFLMKIREHWKNHRSLKTVRKKNDKNP